MTVPMLNGYRRGYSFAIMGLFLASCLIMLIWVYHGFLPKDHNMAVMGPIETEYPIPEGHIKDRVATRRNDEEIKTYRPNSNTAKDDVATAHSNTRSQTAVCDVGSRLNIVEEVCSTLANRDLAVKEDDYDENFQTFINHEQRIFCCIVSKAGSRALHGYFKNLNKIDTSFLAQAARYEGHRIDKMPRPDFESVPEDEIMKLQGFNRVSNVPLKEVERLFHNYTKLIQVRHPLQRFVSGYYQKVFQKIQNPDFPVFVEDVLNGRSNRHWMPYYTNTFPCLLHYDVIIKVETSEYDQLMLKDKFGWESTIAHGHINPNFNITDETRSVYYKYDDFLKDFEMKHPSLFNRLLAFLQPDMDMFGYTWDQAGSSCYNSAAKCC